LKADLNKKGIPTAIHYSKCLHEQPIFEGLGYKWGSFPEAEKASREVISLPMHPFLQENEQDLIISAVLKSLS
jgi:UDP-2-acetamido-2-deoxy-ribo-hexuluronate aminotransferase